MPDFRYDTPKETHQSVTAQPLAHYAKLASLVLIPTFTQMQDASALSSMDSVSMLRLHKMQSNEYLFLLSNTVQDGFVKLLNGRVQELALLALEEEDQCALSQESLIGFWRFFYLHRSKIDSRPQLVLTMEGDLRAIWEKDHNHRIAVRFIDDASVSYVTFFPDRFRPTQICRKGGNSSIEGFFENTGIARIAN